MRQQLVVFLLLCLVIDGEVAPNPMPFPEHSQMLAHNLLRLAMNVRNGSQIREGSSHGSHENLLAAQNLLETEIDTPNFAVGKIGNFEFSVFHVMVMATFVLVAGSIVAFAVRSKLYATANHTVENNPSTTEGVVIDQSNVKHMSATHDNTLVISYHLNPVIANREKDVGPFVIQCQLDHGVWDVCPSNPWTHSALIFGEHTARMRVIDSEGSVEGLVTVVTWTILPKPVVISIDENALGHSNSASNSDLTYNAPVEEKPVLRPTIFQKLIDGITGDVKPILRRDGDTVLAPSANLKSKRLLPIEIDDLTVEDLFRSKKLLDLKSA